MPNSVKRSDRQRYALCLDISMLIGFQARPLEKFSPPIEKVGINENRAAELLGVTVDQVITWDKVSPGKSLSRGFAPNSRGSTEGRLPRPIQFLERRQ
jgi:hypothetical protein